MGKILFSANYMNNPLNGVFTALDWEEVRSFVYNELEGTVTWEQSEVDVKLLAANSFTSLENANLYALYGRNIRGMRLDEFYRTIRHDDGETAEQLHERRIARMERYLDAEVEGSNNWVRLTMLMERRKEEWRRDNPGSTSGRPS